MQLCWSIASLSCYGGDPRGRRLNNHCQNRMQLKCCSACNTASSSELGLSQSACIAAALDNPTLESLTSSGDDCHMDSKRSAVSSEGVDELVCARSPDANLTAVKVTVS